MRWRSSPRPPGKRSSSRPGRRAFRAGTRCGARHWPAAACTRRRRSRGQGRECRGRPGGSRARGHRRVHAAALRLVALLRWPRRQPPLARREPGPGHQDHVAVMGGAEPGRGGTHQRARGRDPQGHVAARLRGGGRVHLSGPAVRRDRDAARPRSHRVRRVREGPRGQLPRPARAGRRARSFRTCRSRCRSSAPHGYRKVAKTEGNTRQLGRGIAEAMPLAYRREGHDRRAVGEGGGASASTRSTRRASSRRCRAGARARSAARTARAAASATTRASTPCGAWRSTCRAAPAAPPASPPATPRTTSRGWARSRSCAAAR